MTRPLVVHTRRGVVEIPLTGDEKIDALLKVWAIRGGRVVVLERGELALADREAA